MRWWTADLHLGHGNLLAYEPESRPFDDVTAMNAAIIERWNEHVAPDDEVWVLGDVVMGNRERGLELVRQLTGRKILVAGNHDHVHPMHRRADRWRSRYRKAGFEELLVETEAEVAGERVNVSHFPYEGDSLEQDRHTQWRPTDDGRWLLHGHVHSKWQVNGRQINVGMDVWDLTPVSEDTVADLIADGAA